MANIGDIQLIISLPNFAASNRKWAVCLRRSSIPAFPRKRSFLFGEERFMFART
ncbi:hypothetical protein BACSTE_00745 [Bacteroides stercoris ATCC 43183]|uniref:Uncharacterized protein n=1 Tax=Bacteroides stercoris ATCC 43183 TaxID=449673 RepID=B0NMQ5_BACSE|nr:hypothetical protein BACSTE_00745 [Bacteroides stercoris ATCC 43183]